MHRMTWLISAALILPMTTMVPAQVPRAAQDNAGDCVSRQGTNFVNRCDFPVTHEWCVYSEPRCPDHYTHKATIPPHGSIGTAADRNTGTRSGRVCRGEDSIPSDNAEGCK